MPQGPRLSLFASSYIWLSTGISFFSMKSTRIILAVWSFAGLLMAENPDPFASYRQVVDSQLSAMLDHRQVFRPEVREAVEVPLPPQSAPVEPEQNNETEMKAFAERYWGGARPNSQQRSPGSNGSARIWKIPDDESNIVASWPHPPLTNNLARQRR
jgi:hypothetical protein